MQPALEIPERASEIARRFFRGGVLFRDEGEVVFGLDVDAGVGEERAGDSRLFRRLPGYIIPRPQRGRP